MNRILFVLLSVLLVIPLGLANRGTTPTLVAPLPFDHTKHERTFNKQKVTCVVCHPVGLATGKAGAEATPPVAVQPPLSSCHGCHLKRVHKSPKHAPATCTLCHANREELVPPDHATGWDELHGLSSLARGSACMDCHTKTQCADCHTHRGPMVRDPHPPGFSSLHGIEARLDPQNCTNCHQTDTCLMCHRTGIRKW